VNQKNAGRVKESSRQYTNIISIDPSTSCTGLCINGKLYTIVQHELAYTKKDKAKRWFELSSSFCDIITYNKRSKTGSYSEEEISKLEYYYNITDHIINVIKSNVVDFKNSVVLIEGFSYGSSSGHLIDLVGLSTLVRSRLWNMGFNIKIIAPADLKAMTARLSYDPIDVGKKKPKLEWRNNSGVSGGSFDKHDMYSAILDSSKTNSKWKTFLQEYSDEILNMKNVPKPIDDINDAFLLYKIFKESLTPR